MFSFTLLGKDRASQFGTEHTFIFKKLKIMRCQPGVSRTTYSEHKNRPIVKFMSVVLSDGYVFGVLGLGVRSLYDLW